MIKYRAFIKVVELGSITKAARQLGYSQPGVSHMLDSLEEEIGFPLLIRSRDLIRPTEDGKKILYYCREIVKNEDSLKETADSVKGLLSGNIRIGSLNSMLLRFVPQVVNEFYKAYPNISVQVHEMSSLDIRQALSSGNIDIGFMNNSVPGGFDFCPLFHDSVIMVMNEKYPLTKYSKIPIDQLNDQDFIMPLPGWDDLLSAITDKEKFTPNVRHYVASDLAGVSMSANELGLYVLSSMQMTMVPANVAVRQLDSPVGRDLGMIIKSIKNTTPALKEFVKAANKAAVDYAHTMDDVTYIGKY